MSQQDQKKLKVSFAPGVLEGMEQTMSAEEMQEFMDELQRQIEAGTLFENSEPVDLEELRRTDPVEYEILIAQLENEPDDNGPTYLN